MLRMVGWMDGEFGFWLGMASYREKIARGMSFGNRGLGLALNLD